MIPPEDDALAAAIRDALHATADSFEPAGDGLQHIQRRAAASWAERLAGRLLARWAQLIWLIRVRLEPVADWARSVGPAQPGRWAMAAQPWLRRATAGRAAVRQAWLAALGRLQDLLTSPAVRSALPWLRRRTPAHAGPPTGAARRSERIAFLRSVVAVAGAVAIVVSGVYALSQLHLTAIQVTELTGTPSGQLAPSASPAGSAHPRPSRSAPAPTPSQSRTRSRHGHRRAIPLPSCAPLPTFQPTTQPSPSPSPSSTPSPVPTGSATPTASPATTAQTTGGGAVAASGSRRPARIRC